MRKLPETIEGPVILIVDDEPANLALLTDALQDSGYTIFVALDGASAIESMEQRKPDIVLMDVLMPGMNGFETCRQIKKKEIFLDIPILFMTALTDSEHILEGFDAGGMDYITKPIHIDEVLARLAAHLRILGRIRHVMQESSHELDESTCRASLVRKYALTEREAEVLYWIACAKTNRSIGEILGISPRTVNKHLERAFEKLGVETRTAAASLVLRVKTASSRVPA